MKFLFNYLQAIATMKTSLSKSYQKQWLSSFAFLLGILGYCTQPSWAEGSKELVANDGNRPYVEWSQRSTAGIPRQTTFQVYVQAGETVYLGSSVHSSANGTQDIVYRSPFSSQNGSCDVINGAFGHIDTITKENLGPAPLALGGYTPCSFIATETGIYKVEFRAPTTNSDPTVVSENAQFPIDSTQGMGVAAWDITVARNGVAQKGRVFTNYIAMNMGSNGLALKSKLYIQTKDGYLYETDMNGIDPYGFIFFANNRGYLDKTNNSTLYRSAVASNNDLLFNGNIRVQDPSIPDTATDITHLVFFNRPAPETLTGLGIPLTATPPPIPQNFLFTGGTGGSGNQTFVGVGGYFSFNVSSSGSYQIIIDTNNDGIFDPSVDRVLQNIMPSGFNVVSWDGKDANGLNLPPRSENAPYTAQMTTRAGEYHFPMLDAENNTSGFIITMENPPVTFPAIQDVNGQNIGPTTIYYNDSNYVTANGTSVNLNGTGATNPRNAARGINSAMGEHEFSNNYGDFKGIDTWTYFPSQAVFTPLVITTNTQANVRGTKSVRFSADNDSSGTVTVGDTVEYTITYSNLNPGNSNAVDFVINDTLPSQITFVNATIVTQTSGNNITLNPSYTGTGALTNSGTLRVGDTITIRITATINNANAGNPIINQANANFTTPDNPTGTVGTAYTDADSAGATTNPPIVGNYFAQTADDGSNLGNDPSKTDDDEPTLFTAVINPPNLLLVKRITRINSQDLTDLVDGRSDVATTASNYVAALRETDDNDFKWPIGYLRGLINGGNVKPGDDLEYTIYFLSNGQGNATNVKVCDLVPNNVTFLPAAFNNQTPNDGGLAGADQGIALAVGSNTVFLSSIADSDRGTFYPANDPNTPSFCPSSNTNGAVVVNITRNPDLPNLPQATGSGTPTNSYGFVRFRVQVR
ncbi:conserved repeat protein [Nostoc sp. PCC 7524]|uniref:isopeptide-forming domain-containing fimbrial protein n=1 Tax=Nostoc sp. (strain ATCC 29411 / PCC 7524) TaxID=28072 RepID=UPI00029F032F|nr:isopeptide-forming domain-containing fimbrial protein [Nostoc sp. PCC 7524]AFY49178.1 conserved repeat protein [Nostoc sp. PCC 7524]